LIEKRARKSQIFWKGFQSFYFYFNIIIIYIGLGPTQPFGPDLAGSGRGARQPNRPGLHPFLWAVLNQAIMGWVGRGPTYLHMVIGPTQ